MSREEEIDHVRWAAFDRLRTSNQPVTASVLARELGTTADLTRATLEEQAGVGRLELDTEGRVVGAHGITLLSTPHTLAVDGRVLHTWCALDAIGIPAASGEDAHVTTSCGWCRRSLVVDVVEGEPRGDHGLVLWLPTGPCDNLRQEFCPHANLFCNREHLDTWRKQAGAPNGRTLTLDQTAELGRQTWRRPAEP